ncbi:hypothetical protein TURU_031209 [Turdus rufiventris]|nr:hypothetical protein TURU_031209 [Turdus rufiventris]
MAEPPMARTVCRQRLPRTGESSPLLSLQAKAQNCCNSLANVDVSEGFSVLWKFPTLGQRKHVKDMGQGDSE